MCVRTELREGIGETRIRGNAGDARRPSERGKEGGDGVSDSKVFELISRTV